MSAVIGALRVDLGLNSAEFQAGLKKAANGLGNFAKTAGIGLAAVATAAAAAGAALSIAVKGSIDHADHMGELAQAVGVSVEALTSYGYAAKMSGASTETLATGLRKLSQNMLTVAQGGTGPIAAAFSALGVSVQNANGSLRAADQVLVDVADKFFRMEDGATKTALAVQLFGRSGAELIPFLNQGRDGIAELTAEADRLGITISTKTASAAGDFNDTLDRLRATFDGVINKIMEAALPALNEFGEKLASPEFAANAQAIGVAIVGAMQVAVDAVNTVVGAFNALRGAMEWAGSHDMFGREISGSGPAGGYMPNKTPEQAQKEVMDKLAVGNTRTSQGDFYSGIFGSTASELVATNAQVAESFAPVIENTTAAAAAASSLKAVMAEGNAVFEATRTPAEAYGLEVDRLNGLLQQGAIDQDTYNRAVLAAQESFDKAESS
ncbi:MAG TPA: phage tail tape measure protein, partial [Devosia sp.]|nr:phage tail tape measure protein [Devosia sp.]